MDTFACNFILNTSVNPCYRIQMDTDGIVMSIDERSLMYANLYPVLWCIIGIRFLLARRYASAGNRDRNVSVCPSVRPSVTRRYCVKRKKDSVMISSPSGSPMIVFWRQISSPNSKGFPLNGGLKERWNEKIQRFSRFKRQYLENGSRCGQSYYCD